MSLVSSIEAQLEAEAIHNNQQLLEFNVRSKDVKWHEYVKPLKQRARPVFLQRQFNLISNYREPIGDHNRRKVLVCHDMMGNYLEDRHYHSSKKYDDYRFYHWPGIDYFCYFSHNYITIPPCGWINAAHKHGVVVLGTFITEGSNGSTLLHEILASKEMVDKVVQSMVKLCKHYKFDGWLVNVECKVNPESMDNLLYFVNELREHLEEQLDFGTVIWYDSIIEGGQLLWQNEVNDRNLPFFKSSNGMLVNYSWNDRSLEMTRTLCEQEREPFQNVFFGIDVFGRGQIAKFQSKQTLARIVKFRFSTGIFAPGWVYETLQQYGYNIKDLLGNDQTNEAFLLRNEKFWWLLWEHLATHPYNALPFYSDFCMGSGKKTYWHGLPKASTKTSDATKVEEEGDKENASEGFFNLSRQSLQPSVPLHNIATRCYEDAFNGGSCLRIDQYDQSFRLFATELKITLGGMVVGYAVKLDPRNGEFDCILRFCIGNNARDCYIFLGDYYDTISVQRGRCYISPFKSQYNDLLNGLPDCSQIPKEMSIYENQANGWRTRYYVLQIDCPIQIKDIGVLYRRTPDAQDTAYFGAVYINEFELDKYEFPRDSNTAMLHVYGADLLN